MNMYSLSYCSQSRLDDLVLDTKAEISNILHVARAANLMNGVTGALIFNEERFTQVLEGDEAAVSEAFASIERDHRHSEVTVISTGSFPRRRFASWTMAFAGTSPVARAYYRDFVSSGADWRNITGEAIIELMLEMISIDTRELPARPTTRPKL